MDFYEIIRSAKQALASDLHVIAGRPPLVRVHGQLQALPERDPLTPDEIAQWLELLTTPAQKAEFDSTMELDFGYSVEDVGRLRFNVAKQQGTVSMVIRLLPTDIPSLEALGLPMVIRTWF